MPSFRKGGATISKTGMLIHFAPQYHTIHGCAEVSSSSPECLIVVQVFV